MSKKHITFIMNPISGSVSKAGIPDLIEKHLDKEKFFYDVCLTEYAGHATELAASARDKGVEIVVAVGGDGTVNEVGRALVGSATALAIIPCGSGNGLARHLLLPMNARKCIDIINACEIRALDYGTINDHCFFCTCGMGFDAFISQRFAEGNKRGPIAYAESILRTGLSYKPETYKIISPDGETEHEAFLISCANASQYGNNAYIAPQAKMSDGLLDIIIMEPFDVLEASQISVEMFSKTLDQNSKIKTFKSRELHVRRNAPGPIHFDGDPAMAGEDIVVSIHEKGIKIVVNPHGDTSTRQPNILQNAAAQLFNDINTMRDNLQNQGRLLQAHVKAVQKKFNLLTGDESSE